METVLVTGGAGFVGSCLAMGVKRAHGNCRVIALDNLKRRGAELNLTRLRTAGVEYVHGDIRSLSDLEAVGPVDTLVECSAEPSVLAGYGGSPQYVVDTNLMGTVNCLEIARRHGADVLFLSTSRVYPMAPIGALRYSEGDTRFELDEHQDMAGASGAGIAEEFPLEGARSLYGATKLCSELLLQEYIAMYGIRGVINRCGVITGPWQMGKVDQGVVVLWVARHHFGGALKYIGYGGTGKQVRDLLHVEDLLDLVLLQLGDMDAMNGQVYNVGGGNAVSASLLEMTRLCQETTGNTIPIEGVAATREADIPLYISNHAKITTASAWRPQRGTEVIFEDIARWIQEHEDSLRPILT